ncbi:CheY chemotaxis protein or a CheY-like REC (receiver) domain [Actinopolyspora alba]|uniref:CheY chemotaxis protein or a CheY-like REC (Receiver) domain n=1 Tax=Actinopolyspora alba TaxID=673379 RepID=A0A1I1WBG6_9ACTN|nr:CheY chemotaxis protein or a CheY-like REC (receiver) domain [Actinopolyspora alba]
MQPSADDRFVVLNDEPVSENGEDLLGTSDTADRLSDLIVSSRDSTPFTLAIDAGWGMGKSSLMRQLRLRLDGTEGVRTTWFNAWTSGSDALEVLIKSVLLRFDRNILRRAYHRVAGAPRLSRWLRIGFRLAMTAFGLRRLVDELWAQLSVDPKSRDEIRGAVRDMAQEWVNSANSAGKQIVVFVDDLDRCRHDVVVTVCEAIKLYLDVPGLVFVIGCDQSALNRSIQQADIAGAHPAGYLEKIVQVNYHSPQPGQRQVRDLVNGYASRSGTSQFFDEHVLNFVAERTGRNPRRIKRLINSFVLEYHLDKEWQDFGAKILVRVLLLQHFYPAFYRLLTSSATEDPVQEFLEYHDVRENINMGGTNPESWRDVFTKYKIESPGENVDRDVLRDYLGQLEQQLPESFPRLVTDEVFTTTLRQLKESPHFDHLRQHLQRRRFRFDPGGIADAEERLPGERTDMRGGYALVVDDVFAEKNGEFSDTGGIVTTLREWGAKVDTASDFESMKRAIRGRVPDIIVSDINRHGVDDSGLQDVQALRDQNIYKGPVVFYVARVTPARREWAGELDAVGVTNSFSEAMEWARMSIFG